ncbi:threonine ammonia-lyase [Planctomycetales bacterium]|nr:threonine ammonia-lyase [Planctomycetales bacterium]GHT06801.1 threonine ammonia-lyase [Planctomycetales bacterium]
MSLTLEKFQQAARVVNAVILETGLVFSKHFSQQTGNKVWFKPENMQLTGAYKIRGALYKISLLSETQRSRGLITASAGNHAQGVGYAAQHFGAKATIVMPETTPLVKVNNTKAYGAKVVLHGNLYDDAYAHAVQLAEKNGYEFVHPFNDLDIAAGQGTLAFEILQSLPQTDVILVPIGGGGLAAGLATLAKTLKPEISVIGVEPAGADSMRVSVKAGKVTSLHKVETIADGVAVRTPGDIVFPFIQKYVDDIITIEDKKLVDVFLDMMESHKMIVENAGLLAVAALKYLNVKDKNVVALLSGGNMDVISISSLVQHGLRNRGRIFTFSVRLPDRPGELHRISGIIARERGNIVEMQHNQFVDINRNSEKGTELVLTLETFGHEHKHEIITALSQEGYQTTL